MSMSATLEDSANAPIRYVGSRPLTKEDREYTLDLIKIYQPSKISGYKLPPIKKRLSSNELFSNLSKYKY